MNRKTAAQLRAKARERQKTVREKKKALGMKELNVWISKGAFQRLEVLQKTLKHPSKAETLESAIFLLGRRVDQHIRDTSGGFSHAMPAEMPGEGW